MSKKLWIFGDSFASYTVAEDPRKLTAKEVEEMERHEPNKEDMWYFQLSRKLGCDKCTMIGIPGSSLDVMQHHFKNLMDQDHISKDDYIVCIHTEASRRWFVPELPEMTNFINFIDFTDFINLNSIDFININFININLIVLNLIVLNLIVLNYLNFININFIIIYLIDNHDY